MADKPVCDSETRRRVTTDLSTTYLLEAGAGTGKTKVLVERYVRCVLDPDLGTGDVRAVAAITFTEKAAGELRQRIREELERLDAAADPLSQEATRLRAALDALDDAPIGTIHGFAGRLLREFPVEAGVDPAFEQLDGLGSDLERARLWQEWVTELAAGEATDADGPRAWVRRLLRAGVRLDHLRTLAIGKGGVFGERYDIDRVEAIGVEPEFGDALRVLSEAVQGLRTFCDTACSDPSDGGLRGALNLCGACERVVTDAPADIDELMAQVYRIPFTEKQGGLGGRKDNWSDEHGGKDALWERYQVATGEVAALRDAYAGYLTGSAVAVADTFSRWAGEKQIELGRLDFTDLLGRLRDLVVRDRDARRLLQRRFRYLLVDEFQDTDPLQAEIVFFLCEREPLAGDWRHVVLEPGKLFVVGDPKQSIYRFRRADIAMYDEVKDLVGGQPGGTGKVEAIEQNFRTTPTVMAWVNNVFSGLFDREREKGRQPGYQWVEPYRLSADGSRVTVLLGQPYDGSAGSTETARRDEARAVAATILGMTGEDADRWPVHEGEKAGRPETPRAPHWGDIAVLYRTTTGLETLEEALREAGVPYRVDGGKTYFKRREVDDALLCLRAVDDPSDGPALYGALHSTFFGFSDDELFLFWAAGGRFDLFAGPQPKEHPCVAEALDVLRGLHEQRPVSEPHELLSALVRRTHATDVLAATGPGGAQAIANLEQLVERARAFAGAGGGGLAAFLAWAAEAGDAAGEQESQVDDEGDLVRLLTIHKAKGLEYPIVIVYGGARGGGAGGGEPIVERSRRSVAVRLKVELPGSQAQTLEPRAYADLAEREKRMAESELRRLLYVATTRARDHLVISLFGSPVTKKGDPAKGALLGPVAAVLPEPALLENEYDDGGVLVLPPSVPPPRDDRERLPDADELLLEREAWLYRRREQLAQACAPAPATSPSGLEHVDESVSTGGPGAPAGRAKALALGSAVHRIMELCDLADASSVAPVAAAVAAELERPDIADEAAELARACWQAAPVRAAAEAEAQPQAVHRELQIGFVVDGAIVSGAIDLLYRSGEAWVVVDYKTDRAAEPDVLLGRYRPQGAAYALAAEAVLGEGMVNEVCFVAARAGGRVVSVPVDDELRAEARREIGAAAGAGRAVSPDELGAEEDPPAALP